MPPRCARSLATQGWRDEDFANLHCGRRRRACDGGRPRRPGPPAVDHGRQRSWAAQALWRAPCRWWHHCRPARARAGPARRDRTADRPTRRSHNRRMAWQARVHAQALAGHARCAGAARRPAGRPRFAAIASTRADPKRPALRGAGHGRAESVCSHLGCIPSFRPTPGAPDIGASWPAASTARATDPSSTSPAASSRTCRRRRPSPSRLMNSSPIRNCSSAARRRPDLSTPRKTHHANPQL